MSSSSSSNGSGSACSLQSNDTSNNVNSNNSISNNVTINKLADELIKAAQIRKRTRLSTRAHAEEEIVDNKRRSVRILSSNTKESNFKYRLKERIDHGAFSYVYLTDDNEVCKIIPF